MTARRTSSVSIGYLAVWVCTGWLLAASAAQAETLTLVHVNDFDQFDGKDGAGGFARYATVLENVRAGGGTVIATNAGDFLSPSLLSSLDQGAHIVALNNLVGLDIATLGNHEFDFGPEVAQDRLREAEFALVSSNVTLHDAPFPLTEPYLIREVGDVKVGFIGLTTPDTAEIASPGPDVHFADPVVTASEMVAALEGQGVELIIALTHLPVAVDRQVAGVDGIDLVLGGHDHAPMTFAADADSLVHKSGAQAVHVGVIQLELGRDDEGALTIRPAWQMIHTAGVPEDAAVQKSMDLYAAQLSDELDEVIGTTEIELDSRRQTVRSGESTFGNLVADAMLAATGADFALTNGGGIRADRLYPAGSDLTRGDILSELPFGNKTVVIEVPGSVVLAALENGLSQLEDGAGRFPQVANLTLEYDPSRPPGERVLSVLIGDAPLDPAATYAMATNDYLAGGGDGYAMFEGLPMAIDPAAARLMAAQVMDYIEQAGSIAPRIQRRIIATSS